MATDEIDFSGYDQLFKDADKDNLVGKHTFMVTGTPVEGAWDDGRAYYDINGVLTDVGNMNFSFRLGELDSPKAIADEVNPRVKRSKTLNAQHWKALALAGYSVRKLKDGDEFGVELYREQPKMGRDKGFLRLRKITGLANSQPKNDDDIPDFR